MSKLNKEKPNLKTIKLVKTVDVNKVLLEQPKKSSESSTSKTILSSHTDIDLTKRAGKKFDITQPPSVSITAIKRDKVNSQKVNPKGTKTTMPLNINDDDDVICID